MHSVGCWIVHRLSQRDCEFLLRLTADLYSRPDGRDWRFDFLTQLRSSIPYEFAGCHVMERSARRMISTCYAPVKPVMPSQHAGFWKVVQSHPLNPVLFSHPTRAWIVSDFVTRERFHRTAMFRLLYRPLHVDCEMAAAIPDPGHSDRTLLLSLHRWRADFSERDRAMLNLALPHIAKNCWRLLRTETRTISGGERSESPFERECFFESIQQHGPSRLTHREREVLFWVYQGKTNSEIGRILEISERTAETHALRAYPKLGVENRFGAITTLNRMMRVQDGRITPIKTPITPSRD